MAVKGIYILPSGMVNLDRSIFLTGVDMGQKTKAPVLIDTGLNPEGLVDPDNAWGPRARVIKPEITEADDIRSRLMDLNMKVSDIRMVIITHLHWDHTGGLRFFDRCPIIVQKEEYRFAFHADSFCSPQYMRNHIDFPLNYESREGDQILLPGISLLKTPGHTPGHQSVLVKTEGGNFYLFTGDAINTGENLERRVLSSNNWNNAAALDSTHRLVHLSQLLGAQLMHSHDIVQWNTLRKTPEAYT